MTIWATPAQCGPAASLFVQRTWGVTDRYGDGSKDESGQGDGAAPDPPGGNNGGGVQTGQ